MSSSRRSRSVTSRTTSRPVTRPASRSRTCSCSLLRWLRRRRRWAHGSDCRRRKRRPRGRSRRRSASPSPTSPDRQGEGRRRVRRLPAHAEECRRSHRPPKRRPCSPVRPAPSGLLARATAARQGTVFLRERFRSSSRSIVSVGARPRVRGLPGGALHGACNHFIDEESTRSVGRAAARGAMDDHDGGSGTLRWEILSGDGRLLRAEGVIVLAATNRPEHARARAPPAGALQWRRRRCHANPVGRKGMLYVGTRARWRCAPNTPTSTTSRARPRE